MSAAVAGRRKACPASRLRMDVAHVASAAALVGLHVKIFRRLAESVAAVALNGPSM
ncbi:hypothetical protein D3C83_89390 [compost metagenome]